VGEFSGPVWRAGGFSLFIDRAQSANENLAHSIYLFGVRDMCGRLEHIHVRSGHTSIRVSGKSISVDIPSGGHSTVDRALYVQLVTKIFVRNPGGGDDTGGAHRFSVVGLPVPKRSAFANGLPRRNFDPRRHIFDIETEHMTLSLTAKDREMFRGDHGPATKMAMSILVRMAEIAGAKELLDISGAHIDSTVYIGDAGLEFAERLAGLGAKVAVPTTLNVSGLDEHHWQEWAVPNDWARQAYRQMIAYQSMGTIPTWTCAPYQTEMKPSFGQQIAWGESNAIVFANSVLGARTERYPDLFDICCAITGRAPNIGLHRMENRAGELLLSIRGIPDLVQLSDDFYPVLGNLIGKLARERIPVLDGQCIFPSEDQLKALGAAAASSGAVALFHMVGVTPEAPTREAAFQGHDPQESITVTMDMLRESRRELTHTDSEALDLVVLGSPHFSLAEFKLLAPLVHGNRKHPNVKFLVTSSRAMTQLAKQAGFLDVLQDFGAQLTVDTCILTSPMLPPEVKYLMTNSAKFAYYTPGLLDRQITFGSLKDCVASAVEGKVVRDETLWTD